MIYSKTSLCGHLDVDDNVNRAFIVSLYVLRLDNLDNIECENIFYTNII